MKETIAKILSNNPIAQDTFELIIALPSPVEVTPGQFAMLSVGSSNGLYLKRPLSIHDCQDNIVSFLYALKGEGTKALSKCAAGDEIEVILPLGKGFPLSKEYTKIALLGGGIGIFPLYYLFKKYPNATFYSYLGYRCIDNVCIVDRYKRQSVHTVVTTDDGSFERKGFITDEFAKDIKSLAPDVIFACGPLPMFSALKKLDTGIDTFISMEERMACGFGACLVCACASGGSYVRTCKEGPVFNINEVDL